MNARSIQGTTPGEIKTALELSVASGFSPTLAIVFVSIKQDREAICKLLDQAGIAIFGATTNGEFTEEGISKESIAILLLDIKRENFTVLFSSFQDRNYRETTRALAGKALEKFEHPCFLVAGSSLDTDGEELLRGFQDIIGKEVNVFGGMAGDDYTFSGQFVFTNEMDGGKSIVALVLDEDKLIIEGRATCGWNSMGTEKTITKSIGNRVYTIDHIPAIEITRKFSGLKNLTEDHPAIALELINFTLQLQKEQGVPVMRPGLVVNWEDGSFNCSGSVPQGSRVKFSLPPDFDVVEKVIEGCEELKATVMPEADVLIIFSCAGRLIALGPLMDEEIEGVRKVWDVPMVGMFSNAEMARATNGDLELHNLTTCCVVLKER